MLYVLINALAIVLGAALGLLLKSRIQDRFFESVKISIGLLTVVLGINMALEVNRFLYFAVALIFGGFIGEALRIEDWLENLGSKMYQALMRLRRPSATPVAAGEPALAAKNDAGLAFLRSSVLFCAGAMSIVGSLEAGVSGESALLLTKSIMDGVIAIFFAATMGWGVLLSAVAVLIYQAVFVLLGNVMQGSIPLLVEQGLETVGGALILSIGISFLVRPVKTGNLLPGILLMTIFTLIDPYVPAFLRL